MKIYLASSFELASRCNIIAKKLIDLGYDIPDIWWNIRTKDDFKDKTNQEFYSNYLIQAISERHFKTIKECNLLILVSGAIDKEKSFTGANVEVGFALALDIPVVSIGGLKRSAMYHRIIKCDTEYELLQVVHCIAQEKR